MTYSLDYRKQVLKSLDEGMTFAEAAVFYDISPTTIQKWKQRLHSKKGLRAPNNKSGNFYRDTRLCPARTVCIPAVVHVEPSAHNLCTYRQPA